MRDVGVSREWKLCGCGVGRDHSGRVAKYHRECRHRQDSTTVGGVSCSGSFGAGMRSGRVG